MGWYILYILYILTNALGFFVTNSQQKKGFRDFFGGFCVIVCLICYWGDFEKILHLYGEIGQIWANLDIYGAFKKNSRALGRQGEEAFSY